MESITTDTYQIHFHQKAWEALSWHLQEKAYSKVFVLVDENTRRDCLGLFLEHAPDSAGYEILQMASGEAHKNVATCVQLWEELSENGADRKSLLINLGGGVLTDLGGFVASTFKRGITFINIPTTLLAMVDASVGGKTGIDLGPLKNQVGVINQPAMVLIVPDFLKTLEARQMQSGFAEMLKHGLIRNKAYWKSLRELASADQAVPFIYESVQIKNEVVLKDPREENLRKILNYGHTLGHAIESYFLEADGQEPLLHGEAIAIGMILEAYLSHKLTGLDKASTDEIKETFLRQYPKIRFTEDARKEVLNLLKFDKKNAHGLINFALLSCIGEAAIDITVADDLFEEAFAYYSE